MVVLALVCNSYGLTVHVCLWQRTPCISEYTKQKRTEFNLCSSKSEAELQLIIEDCARRIVLLMVLDMIMKLYRTDQQWYWAHAIKSAPARAGGEVGCALQCLLLFTVITYYLQWSQCYNWQEWSAKLLCRCSGAEWLWVQSSRNPPGQWRSLVSVTAYSLLIQSHCRAVCIHVYIVILSLYFAFYWNFLNHIIEIVQWFKRTVEVHLLFDVFICSSIGIAMHTSRDQHVCPSVCLSHASIESKLITIGSCGFIVGQPMNSTVSDQISCGWLHGNLTITLTLITIG